MTVYLNIIISDLHNDPLYTCTSISTGKMKTIENLVM